MFQMLLVDVLLVMIQYLRSMASEMATAARTSKKISAGTQV